jgi:predicted HicB family RNase H-like nuclease/uncharacterized protein (DUF433 family)
MEYKGYIARIDYDDEAGMFHGEVVTLRDVVTFAGESVAELRRAFQESVDDYLAFCAARNEAPGKPYSGTFTGRAAPMSALRGVLKPETGAVPADEEIRQMIVDDLLDRPKLDRITADPAILGGRACMRGMRIAVSLVVNLLANGMSTAEIIAEYPDLEPEDIRQALLYAAWAADETWVSKTT